MKKWVFLSCALAAALLAAGFLPLFSPALPANEAVLPAAVDRAGVYYKEGAVATAAAADIVMEQSGYVLSAGNAHTRMGMASTTKIMTALLAIERLDPETVVTVPKEAVGIEGSSIYLTEGEQITVSDLLYGLMLESGNDAATALAIAAGGTVEDFVRLMNERAAELGLEDTHFSNPHGLSADDHYTTAYDLARLTCAALENETFAAIVSCKTKTISDGRRYLSNHNRLLRSYEGCIGVKTGYTLATGRTLVTAAERDGLTLRRHAQRPQRLGRPYAAAGLRVRALRIGRARGCLGHAAARRRRGRGVGVRQRGGRVGRAAQGADGDAPAGAAAVRVRAGRARRRARLRGILLRGRTHRRAAADGGFGCGRAPPELLGKAFRIKR